MQPNANPPPTPTHTTMKRTAFLMSVLRPADGTDCTFHGVSSKAHHILVVSDGVLFRDKGPFDPDCPNHPYPVFVVGKAGDRFHLRPEEEGSDAWLMFGGNFAYSCDSRTPSHPIHIHDRNEARTIPAP